jgi:hypothetical protein
VLSDYQISLSLSVGSPANMAPYFRA